MARSIAPSHVVGVALLCIAALTAATAAAPAHASLTGSGPLADQSRSLDSGTLFWAGQSHEFDGSAVVTDVDNASVDDRTFRIRTVTDGDQAGSLVREFVVGTDGTRVIDTSGLDGRYVIRHDGQPVYVQDGTGYTTSPPDGTTVTVRTSSWEVARQSLTASWSDDRVFRTQTVELEITSNRARFLVEVSADGLSFDDLESMFDESDFAADHDAKAADDLLLLAARGDSTFPVTFRDIENGRYSLQLAVADTDARTTAGIRVGRTPAPTETTTAVPEPVTTVSTTAAGLSPTTAITPTGDAPEPTPPPGTSSPTSSPAEAPATTSVPVTESPGQPGFGVGLTLVVLLLVASRRAR